jgi:hypothetical protein
MLKGDIIGLLHYLQWSAGTLSAKSKSDLADNNNGLIIKFTRR